MQSTADVRTAVAVVAFVVVAVVVAVVTRTSTVLVVRGSPSAPLSLAKNVVKNRLQNVARPRLEALGKMGDFKRSALCSISCKY